MQLTSRIQLHLALAALLQFRSVAGQSSTTCEDETCIPQAEDDENPLHFLQRQAFQRTSPDDEDAFITEGIGEVGVLTPKLESSGEAGSSKGGMTMWMDDVSTMVGGACQYANANMGGLNAPTARSPYIKKGKYCAVNEFMWHGGKICGKCFHLSYTGEDSFFGDKGRPGDEFIQVVDSGADRNFDCEMNAFNKISGAVTGVFPIHYKEINCEIAAGGATALLTAANPYFMIIVFGNLPTNAVKAIATVEGQGDYVMDKVTNTFHLVVGQIPHGSVSFQVHTNDGSKFNFVNCIPKWPAKPRSFCQSSGGGGSHVAPPVAPKPNHATTPAPAEATTKPVVIVKPASTTASTTPAIVEPASTTETTTTEIGESTTTGATTTEAESTAKCLSRYDQCGGDPAADGLWKSFQGDTFHPCCGSDERGPLVCSKANKWFYQCVGAHEVVHGHAAGEDPHDVQ